MSRRLFEGNYAEKEMSAGLKMSAYQRALLLSGVKCPNSTISIEEGQRIVTALEKFQNVPKATYEEIWKRMLTLKGKSEKDGEKICLRMKRDKIVINKIKKVSNTFFFKKSLKKKSDPQIE